MPAALPAHVWVDVTGQWTTQMHPGLLIAWRRGERGWQGWVIFGHGYSTGGGPPGVTVYQQWVDGHLIRPA